MSANVPTEVQLRVRQGIALLDAEGPPDWRERIDLQRLDIEMPYYCVLGQVYGHYDEGCFDLDLFNPSKYGFYIEGYLADVPGAHYAYAELTNAWKRELAA